MIFHFHLRKRLLIALGALVFVLAGGVALAAPLRFTTNPFVTNITSSSAVVNWVTDVPADSTVWYTANPPGWAAQNPNASVTTNFYDIDNAPGTYEHWAVGGVGKIVHSTNGNIWSEQTSGTNEALFGVDALSANKVWAVGNAGTILYYNGTTWAPQSSGIVTAISSVKAIAPNDVWAVGYNNRILHFNGSSWTTVTTLPTTNAIFLKIEGSSASNLWVVGYAGTILHYDGSSWEIKSSPVPERLTGVSVVDASNAWAAGDNGTVLRYNGLTWLKITNLGTNVDLLDIAALDATNIWVVSLNGLVLSTADGTSSWTRINLSPNDFNSVNVVDIASVWTIGSNSTLFHYGINFTNSIYSSAPSTSATLAPLSSNTTYYYMVDASDGVVTISSAIGTFRTLVVDTTPPPAPILSGTTDCTTGGNFFNNLNWTAVVDPPPDATGVDGYTLSVGGSPLITNQPVTNYSHSSLTEGTTYNYSVRAQDRAVPPNVSSPSNTVSLTTKVKDFSIANTSGNQSVRAGDTAAYTLNLASLCGLNENVTLSVTGLPAGAAPSFAPNNFIPAGGGTPDAFTVTTLRTVTPGTYPLTITATSATKSHTVAATLTITPPTDYTVSVSPASRTVTAGGTANYNVTVTPLNGFSDTVTLSTTGLPAGAAAAFVPTAAPVVSGSAVTVQMNVSTTIATPQGTHTLTISGDDTGGIGPKTTTATLIVNPAPDFTISATPISATVPAGDPAPFVITLTSLNGMTGTAQLSATVPSGPTNTTYVPDLLAGSTPLGLPANGTANLNFVISPAQNASNGTYVYTVSATLLGITKSVNITLTIGTPKDFTITVNPTTLTVSQGASGTATVTIATANGLDANVALTVAGLPAASSASWSSNPVNPSGSSVTSTLTVNANTAAQGTYTVTLTGVYGSLSHSTTLTLIIVDTAPPVITFINVVPDVLYATVNWTTNEPATEGIYYWVGTDTTTTAYVEDTVLRSNHDLSLTGLTPATLYTFQIVGYDAAGNLGTDIERTFTTLTVPDTEPPVPIITDPVNQTPAVVVGGTITIQGTVTDNVGVVSISLHRIDSAGASVKIVPNPTFDPVAGTFSLNWDTLAVPNGAYDLFARSSDAAANIGTSPTVAIQVFNDTAAPLVEKITTATTNTTAIIEWDTFGDASTSKIEYGLENDNGTYNYDDTVSEDDTKVQYVEHHKVTLTNLAPFSRYHFQVTSCDPTGNCGH